MDFLPPRESRRQAEIAELESLAEHQKVPDGHITMLNRNPLPVNQVSARVEEVQGVGRAGGGRQIPRGKRPGGRLGCRPPAPWRLPENRRRTRRCRSG